MKSFNRKIILSTQEHERKLSDRDNSEEEDDHPIQPMATRHPPN